ncbi:MAG: 2-methylaconitate cis-trans isomerase PrpF family protein [Lachnospiraceae bacterium]|nr:2-methylaconitate cis-trans isomerase PrpF family protein [Lachnospiraceae bacterium]
MKKTKKLVLALFAALCITSVVPVAAAVPGTVTAEAATQNGVCKSSDGSWYYYKNGVIQTNYTGFQKNSNGWWYISKGKVSFGTNSVIKGTVNGTTGWWYVKGGKV